MRVAIVVLIPVLHRHQRLPGLCEALRASLTACEARPLFLTSPEDAKTHRALQRLGITSYLTLPNRREPGDYARKINAGVSGSEEEWIFLGADDLKYWPDWCELAIDHAHRTGATVIGTNDLGNPQVKQGTHSTHTLVHRSYANLGTADDPTRLLHEGYNHNWVDREFIETARARGEFSFCRESVVEHLHPNWKKAANDSTYRLGMEGWQQDAKLFRSRSHLWRTIARQTITR